MKNTSKKIKETVIVTFYVGMFVLIVAFSVFNIVDRYLNNPYNAFPF